MTEFHVKQKPKPIPASIPSNLKHPAYMVHVVTGKPWPNQFDKYVVKVEKLKDTRSK